MVPFSTGREGINDDDIVVRTARISTLEKQNVNCMTEKLYWQFKAITSSNQASAVA